MSITDYLDICQIVTDAIERSKVQGENQEAGEWISMSEPLSSGSLREAWSAALHRASIMHTSSLRVWKLNDYDWYMAHTLDEAVRLLMKDTGISREEALDHPHMLTVRELNTLMFVNDDGSKHSFAVELCRRIENGDEPGSFASTEY